MDQPAADVNFTEHDLQFISVDKKGTVLSSDDKLVTVPKDSHLADLHPIFENLDCYFNNTDRATEVECVHFKDHILDIDIIINDFNRAVIILRDATPFYQRLQKIAQKKNETLLFSEIVQLKNDILKQQEDFKNKFLGNFAHEMRNPLTLISAFSSMLLKMDLELDQLKLVEAIKEQSDHITKISDDILELAILKDRTVAVETQPFKIDHLLDHLRRDYIIKNENSRQSLDIIVDPVLPSIIISDYRKLEQIITNMLDTAFKFNESNKVLLELKQNQRRANKVSLRIEVRHTQEQHPTLLGDYDISKIVSSDHHNDADKASMGFTIAQEVAALINGKVDMTYTEHVCTQIATIKCEFSIKDSLAESEIRHVASKFPQLSEKVKIIIADESSVTQLTALKVLVHSGNFDTQVYSDPAQLLQAVEKYNYDIILVSASIPHLDALELMSIIKEFANDHNKTIPVIALSTENRLDKITAYRKAGFKDVIKKPFTDDVLLKAIYKRINLKKFK